MSQPSDQSTVFSQITIGSQFPGTQVVFGNMLVPQSVLLVNKDPANTIYLTNNSAYLSGDTTKVTPLPAQSSVVFDGSQDVYAFTLAGFPAILATFPSGVSYSTAVGIQPLTTLGSVGGSAAALNILPGVAFTPIKLVDVSGFASYDLNAYAFAQSPGSVNAALVAEIQIQWFDDMITGIPVFEEDWWIWVGRAAPIAGVNTLAGSGPMHGRYMTINVINIATAGFNMTLQYINVFGSNRVVPDSDWRQNGQAVNPQSNTITVQAGGGTSFDNVLCNNNNEPLTANQLIFIPCGLYAGPAYYRFQATTAALHDATLVNMTNQVSGGLGAGTSTNGVLVNFSNDTAEHEGYLYLPRAPTAFIIQGDAAGTTVYSFTLIAQQAA